MDVLYGRGVRGDGDPHAISLLKPLKKVQNTALWRITRAYKRTPTAALEREAAVPPIDLYIHTRALQHSPKMENTPVAREIKQRMD
jgi:hypothetical protein